MPTTMKSLGIDRLPIDEQLNLVEEIWENITSDPDNLPLTEAQEAEIDRRMEDHLANPDDVVPWEVIKAEADARFGR